MFIFNYSVGNEENIFYRNYCKLYPPFTSLTRIFKKDVSSLRKICFCIFFEKYYKKKNPLHVGTSTRIFYKNN